MMHNGEGGALGDLVTRLDADLFVGREAQLADLGHTIDASSVTRIVHLYGSGGVGKSALLRAFGRQVAAKGRAVVHLDGRVITLAPDAVASAFAPVTSDPPTVVLIDEFDALAPLHRALRRVVLEDLPASCVVITAGRSRPSSDWFDAGLDRVSVAMAVGPLDRTTSQELLHRSGITDEAEIDALTRWSWGYPLALTLAASLRTADPLRPLPIAGSVPPGEQLDDLLLERLGTHELDGVDPDVLDVAAIAPAVDARLLSAVLPGRSTRNGLTALRACRLAEPIGPRVTLHRLARGALRARLRETDPDRYRTLVLKVADHLRSRADDEGIRLVGEMATLIENPEVRLGFDPSTTHYADRARPEDLPALEASTGARNQPWFARLARWILERPEQVVAVRRTTGELSAVAVVYSANTIPEWARASIEVGPVVASARSAGHLGAAMFMQDTTYVERSENPEVASEILRVGNARALAVGGLTSPRFLYATVPPSDATMLQSIGYVEVPALRRSDGDRALTTIVCDFGPAGMIGRAHDMIRAEQQAEPYPPGDGGARLVSALRSFHDDDALVRLFAEPAACTRTMVRVALARAFGDSDVDRDLRRALERTYVDPDGGHGAAQRELIMSRSSFYRFLQRARSQLAERGSEVGPADSTTRR